MAEVEEEVMGHRMVVREEVAEECPGAPMTRPILREVTRMDTDQMTLMLK